MYLEAEIRFSDHCEKAQEPTTICKYLQFEDFEVQYLYYFSVFMFICAHIHRESFIFGEIEIEAIHHYMMKTENTTSEINSLTKFADLYYSSIAFGR
jgi:hypothetical protein